MWFFRSKPKKKPVATTITVTAPPSPPTSTPEIPNKSTKPKAQYATANSGNNPYFPESSPPSPAYLPPLPNHLNTRTSNAFKSERAAAGLNKLQQLQLIEYLKSGIIENAELTRHTFTLIPTSSPIFKVIIVRRENRVPAFPHGFCDGSVYVARLVAVLSVKGEGEGRDEVRVVEESEREECVVDAVEGLWEKGMRRAGEVGGR
ncbi:hypothetical protein NX059_006697 [Plenodomus lindquistii]|nr:hypothetical protein NX059_006697 [Plenodomus lindquistii]